VLILDEPFSGPIEKALVARPAARAGRRGKMIVQRTSGVVEKSAHRSDPAKGKVVRMTRWSACSHLMQQPSLEVFLHS